MGQNCPGISCLLHAEVFATASSSYFASFGYYHVQSSLACWMHGTLARSWETWELWKVTRRHPWVILLGSVLHCSLKWLLIETALLQNVACTWLQSKNSQRNWKTACEMFKKTCSNECLHELCILKVTMAMPNAAHAWNSPCNLPTREVLSHISFEDSKELCVVVDADAMQGLKYYIHRIAQPIYIQIWSSNRPSTLRGRDRFISGFTVWFCMITFHFRNIVGYKITMIIHTHTRCKDNHTPCTQTLERSITMSWFIRMTYVFWCHNPQSLRQPYISMSLVIRSNSHRPCWTIAKGPSCVMLQHKVWPLEPGEASQQRGRDSFGKWKSTPQRCGSCILIFLNAQKWNPGRIINSWFA